MTSAMTSAPIANAPIEKPCQRRKVDFAVRVCGDGRGAQLAVTASNRAGMVYRLPGCSAESRELAVWHPTPFELEPAA